MNTSQDKQVNSVMDMSDITKHHARSDNTSLTDALISSAQTLDALTVEDIDDKHQGTKLMMFVKKHQKFLLLQCILIILIGVSFVFW